MGINSGDIAGPIDEKEQLKIIEALLQSLAEEDEVPYTPPADPELRQVRTGQSRVEMGG